MILLYSASAFAEPEAASTSDTSDQTATESAETLSTKPSPNIDDAAHG